VSEVVAKVVSEVVAKVVCEVGVPHAKRKGGSFNRG
jgi:hypothetical protein